jgi:integrase
LLRQHIPAENVPEFEIGLHTGMRRSEQYEKALWENVDLLNNMITIQRPKKQNKPRRVRLNLRAQAALKMIRPTPARGRLHALMSPRSWFGDAVKAAKLEGVSWHVLRHT